MTEFIAYSRASTDRQGASGLGRDAQRQAVARHIGERGHLLAEFTETESGGGVLHRGDLIAAASFLAACTGDEFAAVPPQSRRSNRRSPPNQKTAARPDHAQDDTLVVLPSSSHVQPYISMRVCPSRTAKGFAGRGFYITLLYFVFETLPLFHDRDKCFIVL